MADEKDLVNVESKLKYGQDFFDQEVFIRIIRPNEAALPAEAQKLLFSNVAREAARSAEWARVRTDFAADEYLYDDRGNPRSFIIEAALGPLDKKDTGVSKDLLRKEGTRIVRQLKSLRGWATYVNEWLDTDQQYTKSGRFKSAVQTKDYRPTRTYRAWLPDELRRGLPQVMAEAFPQDISGTTLGEVVQRSAKSFPARNIAVKKGAEIPVSKK